MAETELFKFLGMNINDNPAMSMAKVASDLRVARTHCDVLVLQEFRWPWYWRELSRAMPHLPRLGWRTYPHTRVGKKRPTFSAQAVCWKDRDWKKIDTKTRLLHDGVARISESRYIRGVLLEHRATGLRCWFVTTHYVRGGDEARDPIRHRTILKLDLVRTEDFFIDLKKTGYPMLFQGDLNIHRNTQGYADLMRIVEKLDLRVHGHHGIEYLFSMNNTKAKVEIHGSWIVPTGQLFTPHEGRGVDARLVGTGRI